MMKPGAQVFYGIVFEGDTHPWKSEDPYYWWPSINIPKPPSEEAQVEWRNECLNFSSRSLIECGHAGTIEEPLHTVYIKASLVYATKYKSVDLPDLIDRYSPGWDRALRDFCIKARVDWDPDRVGWKVSAEYS